MALTKDFKDTIQARAQRDPAFRKALLQEGAECLLAGRGPQRGPVEQQIAGPLGCATSIAS